MEVSSILAEIDSQILKLQQARALLDESGVSPAPKVPSRRGRPKGSKNQVVKAVAKKATKTATKKAAKPSSAAIAKSKHRLSPEGRKRIAEAMKKRWAERRDVPAK